MGSVRVAIAGAGNCASSLVQGVHYYADARPGTRVPGLMHVRFGEYHVSDIEFVAAFDVDAKKVGRDLSEAIVARSAPPSPTGCWPSSSRTAASAARSCPRRPTS